MILEHVAFLNTRRLVLASQSPRRRAILAQLGLTNFAVRPSAFAEDLDKSAFAGRPQEYAVATAVAKAADVWAGGGGGQDDADADLVIAADTIVVLDDQILEKPRDAADAVRILTALSGRQHHVVTGCALCWRQQKHEGHADVATIATHKFWVQAAVTFAELSESEIAAYVATGEPMGKAGAYGIQGIGGAFVERIQGDFYNVMGFPLHRFCAEMRDAVIPDLMVMASVSAAQKT